MNRIVLDTETEAPIEVVGGKARGLLSLISLKDKLREKPWIYGNVVVPRFFVVPSSLNLVDNSREILETADSLKTERYAVRSSSELEDNGEHSFDGIFETCLEVPGERLLRAVHQVRKSARSEKAREYAAEIGAKLNERIPVIVQAMITEKTHIGVVYSKFPAQRDIVKVIREDWFNEERYIDAFLRKTRKDGSVYPDLLCPIVISRDYSRGCNKEVESLASIAVSVEGGMKHPVIIEFISYFDSKDWIFNLLQARRLTVLPEAERFRMPELQEKGLIASTYDLNGTGDYTGTAFRIRYDYEGVGGIEAKGLEEFDESHPEGYVLITPWLQFDYSDFDALTHNKKAVVSYTDLGKHHDMEISRKKGILYLNTQDTLNQGFYRAEEENERAPIETGELVRVVSDGEIGFVFNLSRD